MDSIGDRIKRIRKENSMTQEEFAERLKIKRNTVATYEVGKSEPSDSAVVLICTVFNINEVWLRTGEGDPYLKKSRSEEISEFIKQIEIEDDTFKSDLILLLSQLSTAEWELLEKMAKKLAGTGKDSVQDTNLEDKSVQELEEIYKKEVLPELSGNDLTASPTTEGIA